MIGLSSDGIRASEVVKLLVEVLCIVHHEKGIARCLFELIRQLPFARQQHLEASLDQSRVTNPHEILNQVSFLTPKSHDGPIEKSPVDLGDQHNVMSVTQNNFISEEVKKQLLDDSSVQHIREQDVRNVLQQIDETNESPDKSVRNFDD